MRCNLKKRNNIENSVQDYAYDYIELEDSNISIILHAAILITLIVSITFAIYELWKFI